MRIDLFLPLRDEAGNLHCTRDFQTSRDLEGSVVGQDSHIANASVDLEVSVTDASNRWLAVYCEAQSGFRSGMYPNMVGGAGNLQV